MNVDDLARFVLSETNADLAKKMGGDCVFVKSEIFPPLDDEFKVVLEEVKENSKKDHLIVLLETRGGVMTVVERLVGVMRQYYEKVSFVIPNHAYSAGTVLALSGDKIYMDYYSVLGPIDPQYPDKDKQYFSGFGMLEKFKEIISTINKAQATNKVHYAESTYFLRHSPSLGQLYLIEQAIEHGITLITEWLPKYKFKDWKATMDEKKKRAEEIAQTLGNASKWHSHARGISMDTLTSEPLKLKIDDFGEDNDLNRLIRNYHGLAVDYFGKSGMDNYIHSQYGVRRVS